MTTRQYRTDRGSLGAVERLGTGALRVPASVTRIGVFEYRLPDGAVVRELRPPEEVYAPESLASLRGVPVTDLHPEEPVTLKSWPALARGHVEDPRVVGDHLDASLVVSHPDLVHMVEARQRREVSCGYDCEIDWTSGEWYGAPYDCVQRSIRYNHVALGPRDWARGGPSVRLHLDSRHKEHSMEYSLDREGKTLRVDGVDYSLPADKEKAAAAMRAVARKQQRADQMDPAQVVATLDETRGHLAMALEMIATIAAELVGQDEQMAQMQDMEYDMESVEKMAMDRADAVDRARRIAPRLDCAGLKIADIHRRALEESGYKLDGTETEDELRGLFKGRTSLSIGHKDTFSAADQAAMGQNSSTAAARPAPEALTGAWKRDRRAAKRVRA